MPNTAIKVSHLTKVYKLYDKPIDRLKESLHPLKKQYHKDFYALNDVNFEIKKGENDQNFVSKIRYSMNNIIFKADLS